jgi:membrane-associated phospholipid phosphatase
MKRWLAPFDAVIASYFAIVSILILAGWERCQDRWLYLGVNLALGGGAVLFAWAEARTGTPFARLAHHWFCVFAVVGAFQELQTLIPQLHPFADRRFDHALAALDARWFGDVPGFFRALAWRPAADVLSICYWSYFPMPVFLAAVLYRAGELARFRECVTVLLVAWYLSYLGYFLVPAVGPHRAVDGPRLAELDGFGPAGLLHWLLIVAEGERPDAFPSGHALIAMVTLILAWRHRRRLFWALLPFGAGLVLSTMYLRYHYVVDVAASVALLPVSLLLGFILHRRWERSKAC